MKSIKVLSFAMLAATLAGCQSTGMQSDNQTVSKMSASSNSNYVMANSPTAPKPKVVTEYVPVPVPGQLMPIPAKSDTVKPVLTDEAAVKSANQQAVVKPNSQQFFNAMMTYDYMPGAMYTIYTAPLSITDIQFAPGEKIISEAAGDTLRWQVSQTYSGQGADLVQHILVKPSMTDINNTMVVTTTQRVYHLVLKSTDDNTYMVSVSWQYPQDMVQFDQNSDPSSVAATSLSGSPYQLDLANLNFNYQFGMLTGHKPAWFPVRVFNDGRQTFIQFPDDFSSTETPVLYVADSNGNYGTMVNWRLKGKYMVVDTVISSARLQTGVKTTGLTVVQIQQTNQDN